MDRTDNYFGLSLFLQDPTFIGCLLLGIVIVVLLSINKFEESTVDKAEGDLIFAQLLPRFLATHEEYSRALLRYIGSMVGILCAMSVVGPRLLEMLAPSLATHAPIAPFVFALILVGVVPSVPWLKDIEWSIRRFWHERAFIPTAAREVADTLGEANFDFSPYTQRLAATSSLRGIEPTDFTAPRGSVEYGWARLSCLSYELGRRRNAGETKLLDSEMLDRYGSDLDNIASKRQALEAEVTQYRQEMSDNPYYQNNQLGDSIRKTLRQLYILLGCAVRLKASGSSDMNTAFRSFGFILGPSAPQDGNQNVIIVGLAAMTVSLLLLVFTAQEVSYLGLWRPSMYFPGDAFQPFVWAFSALLVHGVAITTADCMRRRSLRKGEWFLGRRHEPIAANYIRVATVCAIIGYMTLFVWGLIFQAPTFELAKGTIGYALLPAATGAFYGYHLDNAELGRRPARAWEIGAQALATALCALVATPLWLSIRGGLQGNADYIILVTLLGALVGASLAWYLPKAAASRGHEPPVEAEERHMAMPVPT